MPTSSNNFKSQLVFVSVVRQEPRGKKLDKAEEDFARNLLASQFDLCRLPAVEEDEEDDEEEELRGEGEDDVVIFETQVPVTFVP